MEEDEIEEDGGSSMNSFNALWIHMCNSEAKNPAVQDAIIGVGYSLMGMSPNEKGGVLSTARRNTRFLATPRIRKSLSRTTFDIDALKTSEGGLSIYICLPARMFPTHARYIRLFISTVLFRMGEIGLDTPACGHPILFVMDEFASLGHMDILEKAAGLMAGYGIKLWPIVQDLTQLKRHYKESWETFLANAGITTFFANNDLTTLEWLSKRMGHTEIIRETIGSSTSTSEGRSSTEGSSQTEGTTYSQGQSQSQSDMAPLSKTATIQGGGNIFDMFTRQMKSPVAHSASASRSDGGSTQESASSSKSTNSSESHTRTTGQQIIKTPLMNPDEIASRFDRETGLMVSFIGGYGPYVIQRTPYYSDPIFEGRYK